MIIKSITRTEGGEREIRGLGDIVERAVKPIAKMLRLPCLDKDGTLRPASPCAKRRNALNKLVPLKGKSS